MTRRKTVEDQWNRLRNAIDVINDESYNAMLERRTVRDVFGQVKKWKGTVYNNVLRQALTEKYDPWIKSINGIVDGLYVDLDNKANELRNIIYEEELRARNQEQNGNE